MTRYSFRKAHPIANTTEDFFRSSAGAMSDTIGAATMQQEATQGLTVSVSGGTIVLNGDLDDSPSVLPRLREALSNAPKSGNVVVDASDASVVPAGVTTWITATKDYLMDCHIL